MTRMVDGIGTTLYAYAGSCGIVHTVDGPFDNDSLEYAYDMGNRLLSLTSSFSAVSYEYDALGRIAVVVEGGGGSGPRTNLYAYQANGRLPAELQRANGTRTTWEYDELKRLTNLVHRTEAGSLLSSFAYTLNAADERIRVVRGGPNSTPLATEYTYDPIGQLVGAQSDQPGHSFSYAYDPAGNPVLQDNNGFVLTNAFNELNQNVTSLWSGAVTVLGVANITNGTVTVNGQPAYLLESAAAQSPLFIATNLAVSEGSNLYTALLADPFGRVATSRVSVVARDRGYGYDANGNMTNDGQFAYVWDDADRLIEVRSRERPPDAPPLMTCRYDGLGRRRERVLLESGAGAPPAFSTNRYVYDQWLVVAVLDASDQVLETYTHGPDLSGGLGGAGGIGGIISVTPLLGGAGGGPPLPGGVGGGYYHYDGNGNVVAITDTNQALVSTLDYGPFGTVLTRSGPYTPRYQFSTKEYDEPTGLNYYGFRYYSPELCRWLNKDPAGWHGGLNLYAYALNAPVLFADGLGLSPYDSQCIELARSKVPDDCSVWNAYGNVTSTVTGAGRHWCVATYTSIFEGSACHVNVVQRWRSGIREYKCHWVATWSNCTCSRSGYANGHDPIGSDSLGEYEERQSYFFPQPCDAVTFNPCR